jgi:hypothetical protein
MFTASREKPEPRKITDETVSNSSSVALIILRPHFLNWKYALIAARRSNHDVDRFECSQAS